MMKNPTPAKFIYTLILPVLKQIEFNKILNEKSKIDYTILRTHKNTIYQLWIHIQVVKM